MMDEKTVKQLVRMQKQYSKLYYSFDGVCGLRETGVQVNEQTLAELMPAYKDSLSVHVRDTEQYPLEATITIDDVKFFTIGTADEFRAVGIPLPDEFQMAGEGDHDARMP